MIIPKFAVKHPVTTIMMMMLILLLGFVSLSGLKMDLMPKLNPPVLAVLSNYSGAGPQEVNEMVSKPVEEIVSTTQGLKSMQSRSSSNVSLIIAQFDWGTDISEIREDLESKLGRLQFPEGIDRPMIVKFDPTMMPLMQFTVSNGEGVGRVQELVDDELIPQLQNIEGVANISVAGGFEEEISVKLSAEKLKENGLTQERIVQLIQGNNLSYPGGTLENPDEKLNLRVLGKVDSINTLKQLPVNISSNGQELQIISLADIAEVEVLKKDSSSIARNNGKESLLLSIQKEGSANSAEVSGKVSDKLAEMEKDYSDISFSIAADQGEIVEKSIATVSTALMYGALIALLVIFFFLRSTLSTLIIGIAVPFSVISTFVLMYFAGMTLNLMSLGGLALGVGMLVDNAIVVIENIYRHMSLNKSRQEAAVDGALEVAGAVTASTLTTMAVFLPVVFIGGLVGNIFKELALTVTFSLLASWLVALSVVPTLAGLMLKTEKVRKPWENGFYRGVISWALSHRLASLVLAVLILAGSLALIPRIGTEFIPGMDEGTFTIEASLPEGATFDRTLEVVKKIEKEALNISDVEVITAAIGDADALAASINGGGENKASLTVNLVDKDERGKTTKKIMQDLENRLEIVKQDAVLSFNLSDSLAAMSGSSNSIEVLAMGNNQEKVKEYTEELKRRISDIEGVNEVSDSLENGKPEYQFLVDKEKAFKYGLTSYQVASFINQSVQGKVAGRISDNGVETDIRVSLDNIGNSREAIENLKINSPLGVEVALKDIGEVVREDGPITIVREEQKECVTLNVLFEGDDMGTMTGKVHTEIEQMVEDLDIDSDLYTIKTAGGAEMMDESFDSLRLAMILAILLVYMIMASQFESLLHPFTIMFSLPMAVSGVVLGLLISGYAFGITAFIGVIVLVGIVVNNAIVFVDFTNKLRSRGLGIRDALIQAGLTRLRPILMTALTTMLALFPLAVGVGEGTEIQAPMAIAVIGGLFSSTVLTLVVVPVVYSLIESIKGFRKRWQLAMEKLKEVEQEVELG